MAWITIMEFHGNQFSGFVKTTLHERGSTFLFDICTIDESIKGAASQNRYGLTFDGNINVMYNFQGSLISMELSLTWKWNKKNS